MNIGIFDSGLGGLITLRGIIRRLPEYHYIYLGDTARVPYGNRSPETIYQFTETAVRFLFERDCVLIIIACNTASTEALRRLQREFLPSQAPDRRVLGVIIPTAEAVLARSPARIGVIGTLATVRSGVYEREIHKLHPEAHIFQSATPLIAPIIENGGIKYLEPILRDTLAPLIKKRIDTLILGCTHYALIKRIVRKITGPNIRVVSQDEIVPHKLKSYLKRHPEIARRLSVNQQCEFFVTEITPTLSHLATVWFGAGIFLQPTDLS